MKEITFKIPNDKVTFLKDLMKQLGFELSAEISESNKAEVRDRIKKSNKNPDLIQDWNDVKDSFKLD